MKIMIFFMHMQNIKFDCHKYIQLIAEYMNMIKKIKHLFVY